MERNQYQIEYENFKGPANLLLELVRKRKVDLYQIKLSVIISDFLDFIKINRGVLLDTLSSFLYIASILLEIKSNSIIPSHNRSFDNTDDTGTLGNEILESRERQYTVFKKVSSYLEKLKGYESFYYVREAPLEKEFIEILPDFLKNLNTENLNNIASAFLRREDFLIDLSLVHLEDSSITIIEEMNRIIKLASRKAELSFSEIAGKYNMLIDRIISFLSILELYKNEKIDIIQFENFGNIIIRNIKKQQM